MKPAAPAAPSPLSIAGEPGSSRKSRCWGSTNIGSASSEVGEIGKSTRGVPPVFQKMLWPSSAPASMNAVSQFAQMMLSRIDRIVVSQPR